MDLKAKIKTAAAKTRDHIHRNRGFYGYLSGVGLMTAVSCLLITTDQKQRAIAWDEKFDAADQRAKEHYGSEDAFAAMDRHGNIGYVEPTTVKDIED